MKTFFGPMILALSLISVLPTVAFANKTTSQSAHRLSDTTAVFTITYETGFLNRDMYIPILTTRGGSTTADKVVYELQHGTTTVTAGVMNALMLSDAQIKNGKYYIPEGTTGTLTFLALVTLPAGMTVDEYQTRITSLPYTLVRGNTITETKVAEDVISSFITPRARLNATSYQHDSLKVTDVTYRTNKPAP